MCSNSISSIRRVNLLYNLLGTCRNVADLLRICSQQLVVSLSHRPIPGPSKNVVSRAIIARNTLRKIAGFPQYVVVRQINNRSTLWSWIIGGLLFLGDTADGGGAVVGDVETRDGRGVRSGVRRVLAGGHSGCLLYTSPSPRDRQKSRMPSSA